MNKIIKIKKVGVPLKDLQWLITWMMKRALEDQMAHRLSGAAAYIECAKALSELVKNSQEKRKPLKSKRTLASSKHDEKS